MISFGEKFLYIAIYSSFLEFVPCNRFTPMDTLSQRKHCYISLGKLYFMTGISREQTNVAQDNAIHVMLIDTIMLF